MLLKHFIVIVTKPALGGMKEAANVFMTLSSFWQVIKIEFIFKPNVYIQNF